MSELLVVVLFAVSILITVSSLDDAFIDLLAAGIARYRLRILAERPDDPLPKIAVFVANWHEEDVLGKMVEGNLAASRSPRCHSSSASIRTTAERCASPRSSRRSTPIACASSSTRCPGRRRKARCSTRCFRRCSAVRIVRTWRCWDTATAAAAATAGFMNRVPVAHVEAGLRTGDLYSPWPEEFNRRVITLASTLHFPPTPRSRGNLLREGIPADRVVMVGNTVVDALRYVREKITDGYRPTDEVLASLPSDKKLVLATLHRRENIGEPLRNVLRALRTLATDDDKLIVLPVHLNPQVRDAVLDILHDAPNVWLLDPLQYPDFVYLLSRAWVVVSDSGGVQEEAPTFGRRILITRETTERPEVVDAGFGTLVGSDYQAILACVRKLTTGERPQLLAARNPFGRGDSSEHIAACLTSGLLEGRHSLLAAE